MSNNPDIARIMSDQRRRDRTRANINAKDIHSTFSVAVSGTAGTAMTFVTVNPVMFEVAYRPTQGREGGINPAFTFGFELNEDGVIDDPYSISGLVGHAKVFKWEKTWEGYFTGAHIHVGVMNMSPGVNQNSRLVPFMGTCHLHFVGRAVIMPMHGEEIDF